MPVSDSTVLRAAKPTTGRVFENGTANFRGRNIVETHGDRPICVLVRTRRDVHDISEPVIELVLGGVTKPDPHRRALNACEAVVHPVVIFAESGNATFDAVIGQGAVNVVIEANRTGINRMLQISAPGMGRDPRFRNYNNKWRHD